MDFLASDLIENESSFGTEIGILITIGILIIIAIIVLTIIKKAKDK